MSLGLGLWIVRRLERKGSKIFQTILTTPSVSMACYLGDLGVDGAYMPSQC